MAKRTQAHRPVRIGTPLGDDILLIKSMKGGERLGRPFEYELVLLSEQHDLNYKEIIGQNVTIAIDKGDKESRYFNGYISRFSETRFEKDLVEYQAVVVPWLWFLTRSSDCRMFQNMTIPEILKQVFKDHGQEDVSDRLHAEYPKWEYCVQYRETAFNFVSRLMEQEGIYYYFKHEDGKHTMVLCDTIGSHLQFVGYEELLYRPRSNKAAEVEEYVWSWVVQHEVQSGTYSVNDFDFQNPKKKLLTQTTIDRSHAGSLFELYDYPGQYSVAAEGERYSRVRIEERQAQHETFRGEGDARGICTGVRFNLKGHPRKDLAKEYLTIGVDYRIESDWFETVAAAGKEFVYEATLWAMDSAQPFRAPRITPKPAVQGPQTAIVVGPKGEEIHTDKFGRVKVQFPWDRQGNADENSSCWVRVAQAWAGKQWGAIYIPRVGQEVIVDFLEGDPDRPIITGRVYNNDAMPPYELPANKTMSTLKSNSSKGGQGFNEIRYEDKKGEEQIFIHAEKDQEIRVKNDTKEWIGNERHLIVKKDQIEAVEVDKHSLVKGNRLSKTEGDQGETVVGNDLVDVDGNQHLTVKGDQFAKVDGDVNLKSGKNLNEEAAQKISIKAGQDFHAKAGMTYAVDAGTAIHIKGATTVVIEAGVQLSLKAGPSFIDIGASGVAISGPMVKINSGGSAASGGGSSPTAPAAPEAPDPPKAPVEAIVVDPGKTEEPPPAPTPPEPVTVSSAALVLAAAAEDGTPFCEECARAEEEEAEEKKTTWVEIELVGEDGQPIPNEPYKVTLPDGGIEEGTLDEKGVGRVEGFEKGTCKVTFPNLDKDAWEKP